MRPSYFFAMSACSETGWGAAVGVGVGAGEDRVGEGTADGVAEVEVAVLGVDAGGAAVSSLVHATAAVVASAATPAHAIRFMSSSLPPYAAHPAKDPATIVGTVCPTRCGP